MAVYRGKIDIVNMSNIAATAGVGIQKTEVLYAISDSGSIPPDLTNVELATKDGVISFASTGASFQIIDDILWAYQDNQNVPLTTNKDSVLIGISNTWSPDFPEVAAGQYLWTKVIYYYTNNTQTVVYNVSKQGETGPQGPAGISPSSYHLNCNHDQIIQFHQIIIETHH